MSFFKRAALSALAALLLAPAVASAATASIQNLSPGTSAMAKSSVSFTMSVSGFDTPYYQVKDSFAGSTINSQNMNFGGNFQWTPTVADVGTHTITVTVNDSNGNSATASQTITITPPPSITIQNVSPTGAIMPGTKLTFAVLQNGFTNPNYIASDSFSGSSVTSSSIDASGNFAWTPDATQNGDHAIRISAYDSLGHGADITIAVRVGAGPTLTVPGGLTWTLSPGQTLNFTLIPTAYSPTSFSINDKFSGSAPTTFTGANVNTTGNVLWTPTASDAGQHTVTFIGQVGFFGQSASTTQIINVLGPGGVLLPPPPSATTGSAATTSTTGSVNDLLSKIAALQSQLGGSGSGASSNSGASGYVFTLALKLGSENDEVTELQKVLKKLGFLKVEPNGYFGPSTKAAVMAFQKAHGLSQLGSVGPGTRDALNALGGTQSTATVTTTAAGSFVFEHFMGLGDDDVDVLHLQDKLASLGYLSATPNGVYGPATEAAVKKFQAAHKLPQTGYCASETRAALNAS